MRSLLVTLLCLLPSLTFAAPPKAPVAPPAPSGPRGLVFCAPGYPGTTQEAQSRMDELAGVISELAGWPVGSLAATYFPTEKAGLARFSEPDVVFALVPLPFFLSHEAELKLTARLAIVQQGLEGTQSWSLIAKKGAVKKPADLDGASLFSTAGYAPEFVTKVALAGYELPATVKVTSGGQVLSALRKAATGKEPLAVLLDAEQAKSLSTLPFAADLEVVHVGPKVPVAVVATLGERLSAADWKTVAAAFTKVPSTERGKAALEGVRLTGFAPLDEAAFAAAKKASGSAAK
ncbi:MAG: PhnD/SsuA/transferrin family substrate-binding protein [Myxococcaceae bacterium]|nr:PhnD/SsuA/transferrin family substrate-binding protein [Myxococcaceae bacterium]